MQSDTLEGAITMQHRRDATLAAALLDRTRARIQDPGRWTASSYALDAEHEPVHELSPRAVRWCVLGALNAVSEGLLAARELAEKELAAGAGATPNQMREKATRVRAVLKFNDQSTHAEVLSWLSGAAKSLRSRP